MAYSYGLHATALAPMVTDARAVFDHILVGSWSGDPLSVLGDDPIPEDPEDTKWRRVKYEFENVSFKAISMLCAVDEGYAHQMIEKASRDEQLFVDLGTVVHAVGCAPLEAKLQKAFGPHWNRRYQDLFPKIRS